MEMIEHSKIRTKERYSQIYIEKKLREKDSPRMRNRLQAYFHVNCQKLGSEIGYTLEKELGIIIPRTSLGSYYFNSFFKKIELRDVLDSITIIYQSHLARNKQLADEWLNFVSQIFKEEHLCYQLSNNGVVHLFIDEEFEINKNSTLSSLSTTNQNAVLDLVERSYNFLYEDKKNESLAIWTMFEAVETLYKNIFTDSKLNYNNVTKILPEKFQETLKYDQRAFGTCNDIATSIGNWANACHHYRHGKATNESLPAPLDIAVLLISTGACYIRYLLPLLDNNK